MAPKFSTIPAPCVWGIKVAKWLPVLFIVAIVVWSYYAYVVQLNLFTVDSIVKKCSYLIVYHLLLVMFLWSYWQTIFTDTGIVPKQFRLPPAVFEQYESAEGDDQRRAVLEEFTQKQNLPITNRTLIGDIRYCEKCCHVKPDRCHHCSVCGECVLKMDHHCPWVNNCVAFNNYKYFVLFLGYGLLYCLFIAATTLEYFIQFWKSELEGLGKFHILFLFFVAIMFAISLVSLFGYHIFLISRNRSTLESFRAPIFRLNHGCVQDKEGFSLGTLNNFVEIFGDYKKHWFLPVFTSVGDGVSFHVRHAATFSPPSSPSSPSSSSLPAQSYGSTQTSLGDGVSFPQRCVDEDTDGLLGTRQRWEEEEGVTLPRFTSSQMHQLAEVVVDSNHTNAV